MTVRLVDWADEEGARFGKSLFGSSACSGTLDMDEARGLRDRDGVPLPEALREIGIDFERVKESGGELANAAAYLELHIEQGPVLLDLDLPLGAVLGTFGVERHADHVPRPGGALWLDPDEPAQGRLSRGGEDEPGDLRDCRAQRGRLHDRLLHDEARDRDQRRGGLPHHARPAPSRRRGARPHARGGAGGERALRRGRRGSESPGSASGGSTRFFSIRNFICAAARRRSSRPAASPAGCPPDPCTTPPRWRGPACPRS